MRIHSAAKIRTAHTDTPPSHAPLSHAPNPQGTAAKGPLHACLRLSVALAFCSRARSDLPTPLHSPDLMAAATATAPSKLDEKKMARVTEAATKGTYRRVCGACVCLVWWVEARERTARGISPSGMAHCCNTFLLLVAVPPLPLSLLRALALRSVHHSRAAPLYVQCVRDCNGCLRWEGEAAALAEIWRLFPFSSNHRAAPPSFNLILPAFSCLCQLHNNTHNTQGTYHMSFPIPPLTPQVAPSAIPALPPLLLLIFPPSPPQQA